MEKYNIATSKTGSEVKGNRPSQWLLARLLWFGPIFDIKPHRPLGPNKLSSTMGKTDKQTNCPSSFAKNSFEIDLLHEQFKLKYIFEAR